jgi:hypothetical protein
MFKAYKCIFTLVTQFGDDLTFIFIPWCVGECYSFNSPSRVEVILSLHNWNVYSKCDVMNLICQFPMGFYFPFDDILQENIIVKREKLQWTKKI